MHLPTCLQNYNLSIAFDFNFVGLKKLRLVIGLISIYEICTYISLYQIFSFNLLEVNIGLLDFSDFDRSKKSVMEEIENWKSKNSKLELQTTETRHHIFLYLFLAGF